MPKRTKSILFVVCAVMFFSAQARPDDKDKQHAAAVHSNAGRPQSQPRREQAPQQAEHRAPVQARREEISRQVEQPRRPAENRTAQPFSQERGGPRVYAVPVPATAENNRLFHHQHHNNWRPRYNFYDDQYHFYPYVNIAATMDLSADCVSVEFNGQTYFYDDGTFYQQDAAGQYFAVAPPIGIIVNALPSQARQIIVNGQVLYRSKGVCYIQVAQGYQVVGQVPWPSDDS